MLDATSSAETRRAYAADVLEALSAGDGAGAPSRLHEVLGRRGIVDRFVAIVAEEFACAELLRTTRNPSVYLDCVAREGRLTVEMTVTIVGERAAPRLAAFLRAVAEPANLLDKLIDARRDHARGEIALTPDLLLHARILAALLRRLPRAAARHPRPHRFIGWGLSYLGALARVV